ncbi:MAG: alpha-L-fucosidase [Gemmatimonadaceae bacterium]
MTHRRDPRADGAELSRGQELTPGSDRRTFLQALAASALGATPIGRVLGHSVLYKTDRPVPSPAQLAWQRDELALFLHLGVNTFTDREWGDGTESPTIFNPSRLDARAWARIARQAGFRSLIITAKHHDGFCLWPSAVTRHSVQSSPWRDGNGDVVRDVADACRAEGLGLGVYLSPWDRHEPSYGDSPRYMDHYIAQLEELLTRYGPVAEVWFDGANGEGPNGKHQVYDWDRMHGTVRRLQPGAVMFSDAGPDVRWIGNERGVAGETCWSTIDPDAVPYAGYDAPGVGETLQRGHPNGAVWRPGETDVSIRPGWFWHASEDDKARSATDLMALYFTSVGRNSKLLLNVPPTRDGELHPRDTEQLLAFGRARQQLLAQDLISSARLRGDARHVMDRDPSTHWSAGAGVNSATLDIPLRRPARCTVLRLQEPIAFGQTIERFRVDAITTDGDRTLAEGTTIGYCRLSRFPVTTIERLRVTLESTLGEIRLATVSLHVD